MKKLTPIAAALLLALPACALATENNDELARQTEELAQKVEQLQKQLRKLQAKSGGNHLQFGVDYRVTHDTLEYELADGSKVKNNSLLANRLHLKMGYRYNDNLVFKGVISYNKAFGDTANHDQRNESGFADFDWVINENLYDNDLRVKEAYFLYMGDALFGNEQLPWSVSVGRRPSTTGFLANHREGFDKANSPLAHSINVEFDGASFNMKLDQLTDMTGHALKFCAGRGLSNATSRFVPAGTDYAKDDSKTDDIDMIGLIYTPYNDGQYDIKAQLYHATNLIGYDMADIMMTGEYNFKDFGDLNNATVSFEMNGVGEFINDFLDETRLFASVSMSETDPASGMAMLGSTKKETGYSYWLGANFPGFLSDDSFGIEFNHGSKYWRSFTYGEDTMIGSKIAARGDAFEMYYNLPLIDEALTFQLRFTYIDYDYTGSNGFFGNATGTPMKIADAWAMAEMMGMPPPVDKAHDLRATIRYKF
ncbi:DUF3373 family protein [Neiella sp. HB171785]|uniref:DUF3373 family protein n=1 Tax=Neiella litorisoli TaxID=2771431 RepID=A0A8J6QJK4_9GAMM|nr:DUF3373 family protein [Neiella litorisoli]MBD1390308.1 DUF3373 family protein [Neiella litorisoli]